VFRAVRCRQSEKRKGRRQAMEQESEYVKDDGSSKLRGHTNSWMKRTEKVGSQEVGKGGKIARFVRGE